MTNILFLILFPLVISIPLPFLNSFLRNFIVVFSIIFLSYFSVISYFDPNLVYFSFSNIIHLIFLLLDVVLLIYFLSRGIIENSKSVSFLALLQLILYGVFIFLEPSVNSYDSIVDKISVTMLLVINIVGGVIILYALKYIDSEEFSSRKKIVL